MFPPASHDPGRFVKRLLAARAPRRSVVSGIGALGLGAVAATALPSSRARAQIGVPDIPRPELIILVDAGSNIATVTVNGWIRFSDFEVNQMEQGLRFALTCGVWEEDDPPGDSDDLCFWFESDGGADTWSFTDGDVEADEWEDFSFSTRISASVLNKDDNDWTRNFQDEIYAQAVIWASDGGAYEEVSSVRSNRIDRRF